MNIKLFWYAVFIVLVVYLGWEFFRPRPGTMQFQTSTAGKIGTANVLDSVAAGAGTAAVPAAVSAPAAATGPVSVTYSASGFSPRSVTVKKGEAVMWTNLASGGMWIAVDEHPAHAGYDGTDVKKHCAAGAATSFDQCAASAGGSQWSFTFNKTGTWTYHNHAASASGGTVTVTE